MSITPALYKHACAVYDAMAVEAEEKEGGYTVWEGFLTKVFERLNLPTPRYSHVMTCLKEMGCVEQLQRGGGAGMSQWLLLQDPSPELFDAKGTESKRKVSMKQDFERQRYADVYERLSILEKRVERLEAEVERLEKPTTNV